MNPTPSELPASEPTDDSSPQRPTRIRTIIFMLACGTSFVLYLHRYTWGFIKPFVGDEFGWSEWQLGLLDGVFSAGYGFGQIPSGVLCDWFGPHVLLGTTILAWSLSMGAVALATGYVSMFSARLLFGLTQAGGYPTLTKVTKLWFPLSERTTVQGWIATFFGRGGGAVSFVLFGTVLIGWMGLSWRQAVVVLTVLGCIFGGVFIYLFRNTPRDHPQANDAEADLINEGETATVGATRSALRWSTVLKSGNMRVFFVQQFTSAFADNAYVYWIPTFLLVAKGIDTKSAGWMAAIPLVGGAIGGMIGGTLQNYFIIRTGNRRWSRSWIGLIGKLLATVFIFVSLAFNDAMSIIMVFFVVKFFSDWSQPTVWGTITDIAGRNAASVFGVINTVGSIAAVMAGFLMGSTIEFFSDSYTVTQERVAAEKAEFVQERSSTRTTFASLENIVVAQGSLTGEVFSGAEKTHTFSVDKRGEFTFKPISKKAAIPTAPRCRLNRVRGIITIEWNGPPPPDQRLVVDYQYIDYTNGWAMLFISLGVLYLISSLCWLFIDCTKPLDPDAQ
jgi:sugar phosphate permease